MIRWLLAAALLVAAPASAQEAPAPSAASAAAWGRVVVLQDLVGGRFRDVVKVSKEVEIVRAGVELEATPDLVLGVEDAIRAGRGRLGLALNDGGRVLLGERSQVRLDRDAGWLLRLGTLDIDAAADARVTVTDLVITTAGGELRVTRTLAGDGEITVLRGSASVLVAGTTTELPEGSSARFTQSGVTAVAPLDEAALAAMAAARAVAPVSEAVVDRVPAAAHLRVHGGVSRMHGADFGRAGFAARIRIAGPVFVGFGAAFAARAVDEDPDIDAAFVLPAHLGVRIVVPLPRAFLLYGGLDFTGFVGEWCTGASCAADVVFEPGARLLFGGGIELAKAVGLDLSIAGGVVRRQIPASVDPATPVLPELQLHVGVGVFFRL